MIEKQKIIDLLIQKAKEEVASSKEAYASTKELVGSSDMKQEGKYDTRSIEAGYLAGAQKVRAHELELELQLLEEIDIKKLNNKDEVSIGALLKLDSNGQQRYYFLSPTAGGTVLNIEGTPILVISAFSPIGDEVIGLEVGDTFEVERESGTREFTIIEIQ